MNAARKTGALPECHRHLWGLRRGITGDDRGETGALPHGECRRCYGIPGSAGTLPAFTGALPATTEAMPGHCRLSPGHYRRQPGLDRNKPDSAGLLTGFNRGGTGKWCDCVKKMSTLRIIPVLAGRAALANRDGPGLYRKK
ncbi:hypothetical protein DPMN_115235 [Dreissena polymorpha]|uniref:Uncharacterized protein n=1 Tax=Dreissena polymorpha TaxID=45954 RepID=A0A9D4QSA1_DREPO|nr:hypothetical protein DPMN_115235 [Dreissena polymorpha]